MSHWKHRAIAAGLAAIIAAAPAPASAQVDPFKAVFSIVEWFERLNKTWDRLVTEQERQQLLRSIDALRKQLYLVRGDSQLLLDSVPQARPDMIERRELESQLDHVQYSLAMMGSTASRLVTDLGALDEEAANLVTDAVSSRAGALDFADTQLRRSINDPGAWRPDEIRRRLRKGLVALEKAQRSVTRFRNRLAAMR